MPLNAILLHCTRQVPTLEQVVEMLRENGYAASFRVEKGLSTKAIMVVGHSEAEITKVYYAADRPPMIIDFECDLWGTLAEMILDTEKASEIEGFIFVDALEGGNAEAFQLTVDYLSAKTNAALVLWNVYL